MKLYIPAVFLCWIIFASNSSKWPILQSIMTTASATIAPRRTAPSSVPTTAPATGSDEEPLPEYYISKAYKQK